MSKKSYLLEYIEEQQERKYNKEAIGQFSMLASRIIADVVDELAAEGKTPAGLDTGWLNDSVSKDNPNMKMGDIAKIALVDAVVVPLTNQIEKNGFEILTDKFYSDLFGPEGEDGFAQSIDNMIKSRFVKRFDKLHKEFGKTNTALEEIKMVSLLDGIRKRIPAEILANSEMEKLIRSQTNKFNVDSMVAGSGGIVSGQGPAISSNSKKRKVSKGSAAIRRAGRISRQLGANISKIQKELKAYFPENSNTFQEGTPDGKWGEETYQAIKDYQTDLRKIFIKNKNLVPEMFKLPSGRKPENLQIDGIYGRDTRSLTKLAKDAKLWKEGEKVKLAESKALHYLEKLIIEEFSKIKLEQNDGAAPPPKPRPRVVARAKTRMDAPPIPQPAPRPRIAPTVDPMGRTIPRQMPKINITEDAYEEIRSLREGNKVARRRVKDALHDWNRSGAPAQVKKTTPIGSAKTRTFVKDQKTRTFVKDPKTKKIVRNQLRSELNSANEFLNEIEKSEWTRKYDSSADMAFDDSRPDQTSSRKKKQKGPKFRIDRGTGPTSLGTGNATPDFSFDDESPQERQKIKKQSQTLDRAREKVSREKEGVFKKIKNFFGKMLKIIGWGALGWVVFEVAISGFKKAFAATPGSPEAEKAWQDLLKDGAILIPMVGPFIEAGLTIREAAKIKKIRGERKANAAKQDSGSGPISGTLTVFPYESEIKKHNIKTGQIVRLGPNERRKLIVIPVPDGMNKQQFAKEHLAKRGSPNAPVDEFQVELVK